jgi:periplasmic glucans biosynthesis protein
MPDKRVSSVSLTRRSAALGFATASIAAFAPRVVRAQDPTPPASLRFGMDDVLRRARELAAAPFDASVPALGDFLAKLDFDAWRDIRFRPDKAIFASTPSPFRLQTFHLGHLFKRPVTINIIRDGIAAPIPYSPTLFDYGRNKFGQPLPVNLGFAGFRLHYPLNAPKIHDELIAFLGASYFRFLGRGQTYGMSARALTIGTGSLGAEEFPFFREFWVETPEANADRATVYALLDGESVTGAWRFDIYPGVETLVDVAATLFARRPLTSVGLGPITSMFFAGENDKRIAGDFRPEIHDSDGLLIQSGTGEWIWRPLRNPAQTELSVFLERDVKGFGLVQRDRDFAHYQDLDLAYEKRPTYWVEPKEPWGEGRIELVELPTSDESNDNIVAAFVPKRAIEPGAPFGFGYRISAKSLDTRLSPNGFVLNTYRTQAKALGAAEPAPPNAARFIIDFANGDLAYFRADPGQVEVVASAANGRVLRTFVVPNGHTGGFRAGIDVQVDAGQSADLCVFLRAGTRTLTETWTFPWKPD